ncbi:hypothetical protein NDU88_007907 [Pleurodeles waltl]|uniref:Uncharacterized protein n=1 Tax=Pleurodeles waltl TaxID=8319 RepID=A0AAV7PNW9_PLEWA|nr:hypothetical protein NDU88_007907 [Pleurodeles waltl]
MCHRRRRYSRTPFDKPVRITRSCERRHPSRSPKIHAIRKAPTPKTVTEVRSFLGMATNCGTFIPRLATLSELLRALTKVDAPWVWESREEEAFQELKKALLCDTTMAYFDPMRKTELTVDVSPGSAPHPPPRIERWAIQLQHYSMEVVYQPGIKNPADFLSQHPPDQTQVLSQDEADTEAPVHTLTQGSCPKTINTQEISEAFLQDVVLQRVKQALEGESWHHFLWNTDNWTTAEREHLTKLWRVQNELSSTSDGLLRGTG